MPKGINVTHPITTNRMSYPKYLPVVCVSVIPQVTWKLRWMYGYSLGETGEISVILFMSFAVLPLEKIFIQVGVLIYIRSKIRYHNLRLLSL